MSNIEEQSTGTSLAVPDGSKIEVLDHARPQNELGDALVQSLRNMTVSQRQAEGIKAKDRAREILKASKVKDEQSPEGYSYDFQKEGGTSDLYLEYQKNREVVETCAALNGIYNENRAFESVLNQEIEGLPPEHAPGAYSDGRRQYSGMLEYLEEHADHPKATKSTPQYFRSKWDHFYENFNWRDVQNLVTTDGIGVPAAGATQTGTLPVDRPRLNIPVQEALQLRGMLVGSVTVYQCPDVGDTYKFLVEDETETKDNSGGYRDGVASQNKYAGVAENAAFPTQDVRAIDREVRVKKTGVMISLTRELVDDIPQARGFVDRTMLRRTFEYKEDQYINGDGTGDNMTGLLQTSGILSKTRVGADGPLLDSFADFIDLYTRARNDATPGANKDPELWMMRPSEKIRIRKLKDTQKRYLWGNPAAGIPAMLWEYPIRVSDFVPANQALLLNLSDLGLVVKNGLEVEAGFSTGDWEHERFSIKYRMRSNVIVFRPKSVMICKGLNVAESSD